MGQYHPGMIRANMQMRLQNVNQGKAKRKLKLVGRGIFELIHLTHTYPTFGNIWTNLFSVNRAALHVFHYTIPRNLPRSEIESS